MVASDPENSLNWTHSLRLNPYGCPIEIRVNQPELLEPVRALFLPDWQELPPSVQPEVQWSLFSHPSHPRLFYDGEEIGVVGSLIDTFDRYFHLYTGERAVAFTFVHAGVVGYREQAILLPGHSHYGKSTLTRALVDLGCHYFSDDLAVLDQQGRVHPYPKPMSLRLPEGTTRLVPASELGWKPERVPLAVALVADLRYRSDLQESDWSPMTAAQCSLHLLQNCLSIRRAPDKDLPIIGRISRQAQGIRGRRGEAEAAARLLLQELGKVF